MFNVSGSDMDIASPSPKRQTSLGTDKPKSRTLPPFLLGEQPQNTNLFNNTPLKSRKTSTNHGDFPMGDNSRNNLNFNRGKENVPSVVVNGFDQARQQNSCRPSLNFNGIAPKSSLAASNQNALGRPSKSFIPTASLTAANHHLDLVDSKPKKSDQDKRFTQNLMNDHSSSPRVPPQSNYHQQNSLLVSDSFNVSNSQLGTPDTAQHGHSNKIFASSPLPNKDRDSMQTPTMNINAQSLGVCREQKISPIYPLKSNEENRGATPLARQMFEKKMVEQRRSLEQNSPDGDTLINQNTSNYNLDEELSCWVSLFGFTNKNLDMILKKLIVCGSIVSRHPSRKDGANWIHLRFATPNQAQRAIQRYNLRVIDGLNCVVGVVECLEPKYISDFVKGNTSATNILSESSANSSRYGMRALADTEKPASQPFTNGFTAQSTGPIRCASEGASEVNPFDVPQKVNDGLLKKTLGMFMPGWN